MCNTIHYTNASAKQLKRMPKYIKNDIHNWETDISNTKDVLSVGTCSKLERNKGIYRWRFGSYRLMAKYDKDNETVTVLKIAPRGEAYKTLRCDHV